MPQTEDESYKARRAERERREQERLPKPWWWLGQREPTARMTLYLGIFTLGLVLVGFLQWCSISGQLREMKRGAADTHIMAVAESRAWIAPTNVVLLGELAPRAPFRFEVQYSNVGREPALDVRPIYRVDSVEGARFTDNTVNSIVESHEICKNVKTAPGADVIYPNQPGGYSLIFDIKKGWMTADIVSGRSALIVQMCFAYVTDGTTHHTAICYFYRPGVSENKQFDICTAGNHAD